MTTAARYDKYPEIAVPRTRDQAWRGWDAVVAALRDATARLSRDRDRVIVAVECATGLLPEVRAGLATGLRADLWLDASEAWSTWPRGNRGRRRTSAATTRSSASSAP